MIPKGGVTNFHGIDLLEVLWKAIYGIINHRLLSSIQFYDVIYGFCTGRETGTATLEIKLLQYIISIG